MAEPGLTSTGIYPWLSGHWAFFLQRLEHDRLAHALMIGGPAGTGKTALARAMVARLLCREPRDFACGQCRSCKLLAGAAHPDYFDLQPEEDSEVIKVDQVRVMIGKLDLTTSISERKVAYIHPAETMNAAAANALLKSLEEPVGNTVLILVSDNPGRLPVTIRSRCQAITINQPDPGIVQDWLVNGSAQPAARVSEALQAAGGSPLRAAHYLASPELDAFSRVKTGLSSLLGRPAAVSQVSSELNALNPVDLWRWLSICTGEVIKSILAGQSLNWLPANPGLRGVALLELQRQADKNRQLAATTVRGDLLLQVWLINWAEQVL
jgi:DNA polymerase-3 subunit delta'